MATRNRVAAPRLKTSLDRPRCLGCLLSGLVFVAGLPYLSDEMTRVCQGPVCHAFAPRLSDPQELHAANLTLTHYAAFLVAVELFFGLTSASVALVIFWRAGREWIGLLASFALIAFWLNYLSNGVGALVVASPQLLPLMSILGGLGMLAFVALLCLFPDGHFVPSWTRYILLVLLLVTLVEPILVGSGLGVGSGQFSLLSFAAAFMGSCLGIGAQVYRYRHVSNVQQRQQTKWVVVGMIGAVLAMVLYAVLFEPISLALEPGRIFFRLIATAIMSILLMLVPITLGIAVLRYRLWDADIIIRRTLVYGVLTVLLALAYFGTVTLLSSLFSAVSGQQSALAIVVATLMIAVLFVPLRRRTQDAIDRRFFRKKYDAQQVLAQFAITAAMRRT